MRSRSRGTPRTRPPERLEDLGWRHHQYAVQSAVVSVLALQTRTPTAHIAGYMRHAMHGVAGQTGRSEMLTLQDMSFNRRTPRGSCVQLCILAPSNHITNAGKDLKLGSLVLQSLSDLALTYPNLYRNLAW
ncbi:hypothetical protein OE88DRAFT_659126 [Heliocybe sulcata]|uniref:Uncharacterized protein n=1 Tax=Heliocybe sulcata TaxID=5364 RepID=A0A5C3NQ28_9AGAM|nr:hypothetical protein OE88DRAFT_659126 [Heliocybe sulcata]